MSEALTAAASGRLNGAVGAVMPLAVTLPEANALIASVLVMHRHGLCDAEAPLELFPV